jgi:hypothetical protein
MLYMLIFEKNHLVFFEGTWISNKGHRGEAIPIHFRPTPQVLQEPHVAMEDVLSNWMCLCFWVPITFVFSKECS